MVICYAVMCSATLKSAEQTGSVFSSAVDGSSFHLTPDMKDLTEGHGAVALCHGSLCFLLTSIFLVCFKDQKEKHSKELAVGSWVPVLLWYFTCYQAVLFILLWETLAYKERMRWNEKPSLKILISFLILHRIKTFLLQDKLSLIWCWGHFLWFMCVQN